MSIPVECPACEHEFDVPDEFGGKQGKCPECGNVFVSRAVGNGVSASRTNGAASNSPPRRPALSGSTTTGGLRIPTPRALADRIAAPAPTVTVADPASAPAPLEQHAPPVREPLAAPRARSEPSPRAIARRPSQKPLAVTLVLLLLAVFVGGGAAVLLIIQANKEKNEVAEDTQNPQREPTDDMAVNDKRPRTIAARPTADDVKQVDSLPVVTEDAVTDSIVDPNVVPPDPADIAPAIDATPEPAPTDRPDPGTLQSVDLIRQLHEQCREMDWQAANADDYKVLQELADYVTAAKAIEDNASIEEGIRVIVAAAAQVVLDDLNTRAWPEDADIAAQNAWAVDGLAMADLPIFAYIEVVLPSYSAPEIDGNPSIVARLIGDEQLLTLPIQQSAKLQLTLRKGSRWLLLGRHDSSQEILVSVERDGQPAPLIRAQHLLGEPRPVAPAKRGR